jgi:hypothetical protein
MVVQEEILLEFDFKNGCSRRDLIRTELKKLVVQEEILSKIT